MAICSCPEEPGRPARVLQRWLDLLGPEVVRERGEGFARLAIPLCVGRDFDWLLRWRTREDRLEIQIGSPSGILGDIPRRALESLSFAIEVSGAWVDSGPSSGCAPPRTTVPGAPNWTEAIDREFRARGLVLLREQVEVDANVTYYGPAGGVAEWQVIADHLGGIDPTLEISHDSVPFDAAGEREVLEGILRRLAGK
jgi:hypothetical protein